VLLERGHVGADRGARHVQLVGRLGEGGALGDPGENLHGQQLVHAGIVRSGRTVVKVMGKIVEQYRPTVLDRSVTTPHKVLF